MDQPAMIGASSMRVTRESRGLAPQPSALEGLLGSSYHFSDGAGRDNDPPGQQDDTTRGGWAGIRSLGENSLASILLSPDPESPWRRHSGTFGTILIWFLPTTPLEKKFSPPEEGDQASGAPPKN